MNKYQYRMSQSGFCPKHLSYIRLGYEPEPPSEALERQGEEGKWHEKRIKDELRADDIAVYDEQEEVSLEYPDFTLLGHLDGIVNNHGEEMLLEIKSMSQFEFDRWLRRRFESFPHYAAQLTCYMKASGLNKCLYIVKNRNNGFEDKQIVERQPSDFQSIIDKVTDVEQLAQNCQPTFQLASSKFDPDLLECRRCEFKRYCMPVPAVLAAEQELELGQVVAQWRKGKALSNEGESLMDSAKTVLAGYASITPEHKLIFEGLLTQIISQHRESYSKEKLLKLFSPEVLKPALEVKDIQFPRVQDLREEKDNG